MNSYCLALIANYFGFEVVLFSSQCRKHVVYMPVVFQKENAN